MTLPKSLLLLSLFFLCKTSISQVNLPSVLHFNTATLAINRQEFPANEWCETYYFDKISTNLIYSKTCDGKLYKLMITRVNDITNDPNEWHRDYSGYDPDKPVYNNNGQLVPNKQFILSYYYGKYSILSVHIDYSAAGQILKSTAMKYSNTEKPIR